MLAWFTDNLGTIAVSLILMCIVAAVVVSIIRDKKHGRSSCGCGCEHCAMHGKCHK